MSSPPPKDWKKQVQEGVGEGEVIGETKSKYYGLLLAIHDHAEAKRVPFTVMMIDILEEYCDRHGISVKD